MTVSSHNDVDISRGDAPGHERMHKAEFNLELFGGVGAHILYDTLTLPPFPLLLFLPSVALPSFSALFSFPFFVIFSKA